MTTVMGVCAVTIQVVMLFWDGGWRCWEGFVILLCMEPIRELSSLQAESQASLLTAHTIPASL